MVALRVQHIEVDNPLDRVERLAVRRAWAAERTTDCEVSIVASGAWSDQYISLSWHDELELLLVASSYDMKVPQPRRAEIERLMALINAQLLQGHFDSWAKDGAIVYRNSLVLAGGAVANDAQCEALVRLCIEQCQAYYPAIQYVCWAGKSAEEAMASTMFHTIGEA
jgi:hypothetical protein